MHDVVRVQRHDSLTQPVVQHRAGTHISSHGSDQTSNERIVSDLAVRGKGRGCPDSFRYARVPNQRAMIWLLSVTTPARLTVSRQFAQPAISLRWTPVSQTDPLSVRALASVSNSCEATPRKATASGRHDRKGDAAAHHQPHQWAQQTARCLEQCLWRQGRRTLRCGHGVWGQAFWVSV